ncbi:hypothetical protein IB229_10835 [Pseudomonas sp. PDM14]|uniref:hypothetical protein n=1 Tax=Pseudomonas sp. PDM14 TaxID=2769288 RepID=UPI00177C3F65|nr:hypothetical protein [Pseudomonas sp. PDM14]MBD9483472.1 hypothetical protein [Pseudomonas sp. PDM14]
MHFKFSCVIVFDEPTHYVGASAGADQHITRSKGGGRGILQANAKAFKNLWSFGIR